MLAIHFLHYYPHLRWSDEPVGVLGLRARADDEFDIRPRPTEMAEEITRLLRHHSAGQ